MLEERAQLCKQNHHRLQAVGVHFQASQFDALDRIYYLKVKS